MIEIKFNLTAESLDNSKSDLNRVEEVIKKEIDKWEFRFWAEAKDRKYYEKFIYPLGIKEGRNNSIEVRLIFIRAVCNLFKSVEDKIALLNKDLELIEKYITEANAKGCKYIAIASSELNCKNISTIEEIIHPHGFEVTTPTDDDKLIIIKW